MLTSVGRSHTCDIGSMAVGVRIGKPNAAISLLLVREGNDFI